ncbi:MAG: CHAT domain-containing protein [Paraglaciecola sp.]|jgi:CHAT domain-containing protein
MNKFILALLFGLICPALYSNTSYFIDDEASISQQKLSSNQVLLFYKITEDNTFLEMTLLRKTQQEWYKISLPTDFSTSILSFYEQLQDFALVQKSKRTQFIQTSYQFYQMLLQPFEKHLQNGEQLIVIGQGILQYLPFEVLLSSEDNRPFETLDFLVKNHSISYFFQPANFIQAAANSPSIFKTKMLGFAPIFSNSNDLNDDFSAHNSRNSNPSPSNFFDNIPPLPYSEQEVKNIPKILPIASDLLLNQAAQKSTLQQKLQQNFQYIHLATHSFADFDDKNNTGILCAGGPNECDPTYEILYTKDIEKLRINTDLVVLSSCQSGVGQLDSEGVHGIHRSFYKAGAQNVVFSLWKVNDRICQRFMSVFYSEIANGKPYSTALRIAKLDLLNDPNTASPNVWAAFLMIGK